MEDNKEKKNCSWCDKMSKMNCKGLKVAVVLVLVFVAGLLLGKCFSCDDSHHKWDQHEKKHYKKHYDGYGMKGGNCHHHMHTYGRGYYGAWLDEPVGWDDYPWTPTEPSWPNPVFEATDGSVSEL